jgi:hypothetical protein
MLNVVHLNPVTGDNLVFKNTTPTGGDFGAHVWGPAYLRDHLLPAGWFNGWTMDWYAGMPAYRFYMVLPAMAIVLVNVFLPYGVAMKLVSVLGLITLPACCWAFGRLGRFRYPMPELFAFAGLCFALDESFAIYGGNLKSTMAGEFSFSIALSLGVLGLGLYSAGLRTGKYRVWSAVLIAAACVSHGIVLIFVVGAALIFSLVWVDRTRLVYAVTTGGTALLLIMWWAGPFLLNHAFMTDMKYGGEPGQGSFDSWWDMFFPLTAPLDTVITVFAVIGFVTCIVRRHLNGVALGVTGVVLVAGVFLARDSLPVIGLLWNPRLLPFLYLVRYLLMMIGIVETFGLLWNLMRDLPAREVPGVWASSGFAVTTAVGVALVLGFMYQVLPGGGLEVKKEGEAAVYTWGPFTATSTNTKAVANGWSRYNFEGYEGRGSYYTEYHHVVTTMAQIGRDSGCGRATWENNENNGQYGTTMALMLLPFWTDGCIGSMEGLFFEASGTTPYHFLTAGAVSKQSSNPVRELRYVNNDIDVGVPHLRDLGVRYLMVRTTEAKQEAQASPDLRLLAESYPWEIYLVEDSNVIEPLGVQPVVVNRRGGDQRERNLELGTSWFQHHDEWAAMPADDGPAEWQRIDVAVDMTRHEQNAEGERTKVEIVKPVQTITTVPLPEAKVSNVRIDDQEVSFDVDRPGVPILIKVSYFPNWKASGAEGPYRIGPNMMVVVPTGSRVELHYGQSFSDYATALMTLVGIGLCVLWRRRGDVVHAASYPVAFGAGRPVADATADAPGRFEDEQVDDGPVIEGDPDVWGRQPDPDEMLTDAAREPDPVQNDPDESAR